MKARPWLKPAPRCHPVLQQIQPLSRLQYLRPHLHYLPSLFLQAKLEYPSLNLFQIPSCSHSALLWHHPLVHQCHRLILQDLCCMLFLQVNLFQISSSCSAILWHHPLVHRLGLQDQDHMLLLSQLVLTGSKISKQLRLTGRSLTISKLPISNGCNT